MERHFLPWKLAKASMEVELLPWKKVEVSMDVDGNFY